MKRPAKKAATTATAHASPFQTRKVESSPDKPLVHTYGKGFVCDTEALGHKMPHGRSITEIVVDASEGFIPLWEKDTILRWHFRETSLRQFARPEAAKNALRQLFAEALVRWGDAAPVKFKEVNDAWDFEIVVRRTDDCDQDGCVLASSFFPDAGRHPFVVYPKMFTQTREEQVETFIHELGHTFGLRHFFAQVSETAFPSEVFGTHRRFSIMNYGSDSHLTPEDKSDLKRLYRLAWTGQLTHINGTPIRFMRPFHTLAAPVDELRPAALVDPFARGHAQNIDALRL